MDRHTIPRHAFYHIVVLGVLGTQVVLGSLYYLNYLGNNADSSNCQLPAASSPPPGARTMETLGAGSGGG